jgi:hypothetical protein
MNGSAQYLRGVMTPSEQFLRGRAADCVEFGGFWVGTSAAQGGYQQHATARLCACNLHLTETAA